MQCMPRTLLEAAPIKLEQALQRLEHLLLALDYTHRKGLLHCDIKPSNLLIDEDNRLCLADFGQSRFLSGTQGGAWGTLGWMPPEQALLTHQSSSPNVSWDIYAAGAVAYWMLSGRVPRSLEQPNLQSYAQQLRDTPLIGLTAVDGDLNDILTHCLALDPEKRPGSVADILQDLQRRRQRLPLLCRRPWSALYLASRALQRPSVVVPLLLLCLLISSLVWANRSLSRLNERLSQTLRNENEVNASLLFEKGLAIEESEPALARLWWLEALRRSPDDFVFRYRLLPAPLGQPREQKIAWKWNGWQPE
jgi:serine/threonine protein kinase